MGLDVLMFQTDKDGNPAAIKASQRARFKSEDIVDEIQEDYKQWTRGMHTWPPRSRTQMLTEGTVKFELDETNKAINATQKEIGKIMKVAPLQITELCN
jgi:seryl-tRNA synthetase